MLNVQYSVLVLLQLVAPSYNASIRECRGSFPDGPVRKSPDWTGGKIARKLPACLAKIHVSCQRHLVTAEHLFKLPTTTPFSPPLIELDLILLGALGECS